jgi:hypothetical protein
VIAMIVLLKVACMWAIPFGMFFFTLFFVPLPFGFAMIGLLPPLSHDRSSGALSGPRIRMSPLASHGESLPMSKTAVASNIHQSLDVHGHFPA